MLDNIRIVLVRTFHSGNIGSTARAMKTMGLKHLVLVNPKKYKHDQALQMAMSADDVVTQTEHKTDLKEAIQECTLVFASTARSRGFDLPAMNPEKAAKQALIQARTDNKIAIVFGPERMGLSNEDLQCCTHRITIPANPEYSSLNIASAVQIVCYELFKQALIEDAPIEEKRILPPVENLENFYKHLETTLSDTGFIIQNHPGDIMSKLRTLFSRAQMDEQELNIMRGILASMNRTRINK